MSAASKSFAYGPHSVTIEAGELARQADAAVRVSVGDTVEPGQGLIVVEAMKMQNEMKSPKAGTVVEIKTKDGATVSAGQILIVIE